MTETTLLNGLNLNLNDDLNKNEKITQMLQTIYLNLQDLQTKIIVNKDNNRKVFQETTDIIKQSKIIIPDINVQTTTPTQTPQNECNNNNSNNVNIENQITEYQNEIKSLKEMLENEKTENLKRDDNNNKELNQLSTQIDQLQKVIFILEKKNKSTESSFSDINSSLETLIEKGRLQMKSLLYEKSKSEQYIKQFNKERDITTQLRKENLHLKTKLQEMLFLLQKASEEDEDYYQTYSNEAFKENQLLRELLGISNTFKTIENGSNNDKESNNNNTKEEDS